MVRVACVDGCLPERSEIISHIGKHDLASILHARFSALKTPTPTSLIITTFNLGASCKSPLHQKSIVIGGGPDWLPVQFGSLVWHVE